MIKILIVDDSVLFTVMLKTGLSPYSMISVAATAVDPYDARDKILSCEPDIMILNIDLPRMDGITFIKRLLPQYKLPVIMISDSNERAKEAVLAGAVSFICKPNLTDKSMTQAFIKQIAGEIMSIAGVNVSKCPVLKNGASIIALGASTGGTDALEVIVSKLPKNSPPIIITQHMPPVFTKMYAERLNRNSQVTVCEAVDGMRLKNGLCVVAEGGKHLELFKDAAGYYITSREGERVSGHCPSVDVMFTSVAKCCGNSVVAALLTGMGADGAKGMLLLRQAGAYTIGQNKESCVVYGMPMEAFNLGAVCEEAPLDEIAGIIMRKMQR